MSTLIKEKEEVARLRDLYETEQDPLIKESIRFRLANARLEHDIAELEVLNPKWAEKFWAEKVEQVKAKARKRVKYAVIAITIAVVLVILFFSGCKAGAGIGIDGELFWPNIKTAKGGAFGDPDESRKHSTQHTTGMARNNELPMVGGGK